MKVTSGDLPATMQAFAAEDLKYVYSPAHKPIGSVQPGERFIVDTPTVSPGATSIRPISARSLLRGSTPISIPSTGPIRVNGAEPGGAVEIYIEDIDVTTPAAVVISRCAALSPADWWHEEYHAVSLRVADGRIWIRDNWSVPVRPLIGCLATAPAPRDSPQPSRRPTPTAGTWTAVPSPSAPPSSFPSRSRAGCCISVTARPPWARARSRARRKWAPGSSLRPRPCPGRRPCMRRESRRHPPDYDRVGNLARRRLPGRVPRAQALARGRVAGRSRRRRRDHGNRCRLWRLPGQQRAAHRDVHAGACTPPADQLKTGMARMVWLLAAFRKYLAAIHDERLAGDIAGFPGGQEPDAPADILGLAKSCSAGSPRACAVCAPVRASSNPGVRMLPGSTALMVIPSRATSTAADRRRPSIAALDAP